MRVTDITRRALATRRFAKQAIADGFEDLGERGGRLWQIYRGERIGQVIKEARIAPDGMSVWVRIGKIEP